MVMIETAGRDPKQTFDDLTHVFFEAMRAGMTPVRLEIGFFQARDLKDLHEPNWRERGMAWPGRCIWVSIRHYESTPLFINQLEDRVRLTAQAPIHYRGQVGMAERIFEVDRSRSQAEPI